MYRVELGIDEFKYVDYNHPLMYRVGELWGYYNLHPNLKKLKEIRLSNY
ncbi:MAG: hypothetical protein RLZZ546_1101 [Bacteroidota bacterium]|jgi:hypothetical protein